MFSITSWQIDGEKVETVTDFIFLGSKSMQVEILRIISRTYQVVLYPYIFLLPLFGSEFRCADHRASTMENPGNSPARGWDKLEGAQVPYIFTQDSNFHSFESLLFALL